MVHTVCFVGSRLNTVPKNKNELKYKTYYRGYTKKVLRNRFNVYRLSIINYQEKCNNIIELLLYYILSYLIIVTGEIKKSNNRDVLFYFPVKYQIVFDVLFVTSTSSIRR